MLRLTRVRTRSPKRNFKQVRTTMCGIGLYRPWGFDHNSFIVFHTRNMEIYSDAVHRRHNYLVMSGAMEVAAMQGIVRSPTALYSNSLDVSYADLKIYHSKLIQKLKLDGNEISHPAFLVYSLAFPMVRLNKQNHNERYIDRVLFDL
jgi:hypothetical protein